MSGIGGGGQLTRKNTTGGCLTKNSVIKCSVDSLELDEGLIVVSFAHKDNLYQGVLLQLNRERGIPVGISFPKDFFSEDKKCVEQPSNPIPTAPPPPLTQRNTYFQETDNGRQYRSLRRVIKTPARFKNSRMSLRPVQRPVLCAKCGALCNEKDKDNGGESGAVGQSCNSNTESELKSKKNGDTSPKKSVAGVTPNNNSKTKDIKSKLELNPKVRLSKLPQPNNNSNKTAVAEDPDPTLDYNYQGVGNVGVLDNVWKRPLNKPLRYHTRHSVNAATATKPLPARLIKPPMKIVSKSSETDKITPTPTSSSSSTCPVFHITRAPYVKSSEKSRKANNLKLCIKRLTMKAQGSKLEYEEPENCSPPPQDVVPPMKIPIRKTTQKLKLKRRNSTMPFRRFYDKSKNSPTWRTRKISTMSNPDDIEKVNYMNEDICDPLRLNLRSIKEADRINYQAECGNGGSIKSPTHYPPLDQHPQLSSDLDLSPIQSPERFEDFEDGIPHKSSFLNNKPEPPCKTPVIKKIKITFGTSGNGVVVQIPPTNTNNYHKSPPAEDVGEGEDSNIVNMSDIEAKAVRKALKKARKEAKRKQSEKTMPSLPTSSCSSMCPVLEPYPTAFTTTSTPLSPSTKPALAPLTIHLNSSSQPHLSSPVRACSPNLHLLTPLFFTPTPVEDSTIAIDSEGECHGKKKKKAKKRKRQKEHKENDHHSFGESHHYHAVPVAETITAPGLVELSSSPIIKSEIINPSQLKPDPHPNPPTLIIPMISNGPRSPPLLLSSTKDDLSSPPSDGGTLPSPANNPIRVCISLKRLKEQSNAYVPWNSSSNNCSRSSDEHNGTTSEAENDEPHEFQDFHQIDESAENSSSQGVAMESIESYNHVQSNQQYKRGDVVWGKSTGCAWWPGKIVDIQLREGGGVEDASAKIAWYKSATQSCIGFADLHPFEEYFETKYTKNRKRGCYQQAVREALIDAHPMNLEDFVTD